MGLSSNNSSASSPSNSSRQRLVASDLSYERFGEPVFRPVSLEVGPGESVYIRGANGSGKSTLLRLLAGLLTPATGQLHQRAEFLYLGHQSALKADLTVWENLTFSQNFDGRATSDQALADALVRLDIAAAAHQRVSQLSAGQSRRAGLARLALQLDTPLWLLDEPASNLDQDGTRRVDELLLEHASGGGGNIICSHLSPPAGLTNTTELWLNAAAEREALT